MNRTTTPKEILGGPDGKARCQCGRLRYPRYKLCPRCYYDRKDSGPEEAQEHLQRENRSTSQPLARGGNSNASETPQRLTPEALKNLSTAELLQLRPSPRMPLPDRGERIRFLERLYGQNFRGKEIRYMKNSQLYAISQQAGYRK